MKNQRMAQKYLEMEAKMDGVKISLSNVQTTEQMTETMQKMGKILGQTSGMVNIKDIQKTVMEFTAASERQGIIGEMVQDTIDDAEDTNIDGNADDLIDGIEQN